MCTFEHDPKIKLPTEKSVTVYKVFGKSYSPPIDFNEENYFKFGWNKWDEKYNCDQRGFQVFVEEEEADRWVVDAGCAHELVCPVIIRTKDIVKATNYFKPFFGSDASKVYEVSSFAVWKKDWKKVGGE